MAIGFRLKSDKKGGNDEWETVHPEQVIHKLTEPEVKLGKGQVTAQVFKKLGIAEKTYYRWRREYGGLRVGQTKRLKALAREIAWVKKLVVEQALENAILPEAAQGNF